MTDQPASLIDSAPSPYGDPLYQELTNMGEPQNAWEREIIKVIDTTLAKGLRWEQESRSELNPFKHQVALQQYSYAEALLLALRRFRQMREAGQL